MKQLGFRAFPLRHSMGYPALMALQAQAFHKPLKGPDSFLGDFQVAPWELQWLSVDYNGL